jgi:hypothetical protein
VQLDRATFDHVGIPTNEKKESETWVESTRVWVTNPREHPCNIEWLRFEPDSPVTGPSRTEPHVAYRVQNVDEAVRGHEILLEPFEVGGGFARVAYVSIGGMVVELMQYANPDEEGWF